MAKIHRLRKTKVIATIGPACDNEDVIGNMIIAGMNVARLNLSHDSYDKHTQRIETIHRAADRLNANVAIMMDTKGIEIRTGKVRGDSVELVAGSEFSLYVDGRVGDENGVSVTYESLCDEVKPGVPILFDDGAIELKVNSVESGIIHCVIIRGGRLRNSKGVNLPDTVLALDVDSGASREELIFAAENHADYLAASFVRNAEDVHAIRRILEEHNADIPIIAKIENRSGVENLAEIVDAANGTMVARGDLGVEVSVEDVPMIQKKIIRMTVMNGKPVITATQMLDSMEENLRPTRAEVSDVANAILDGTSAVMLSGETAVGKHPIASVRTMAKLALRTEASLKEFGYLQKILPHTTNLVTEAVSQAAITMANHLNVAIIITLTETGFTSRQISKYRPECPILAISTSQKVVRKLAMNWGVIPILYEGEASDDAKILFASQIAKELGYAEVGDIAIAAHGRSEQAGGTDLIRVVTVGE